MFSFPLILGVVNTIVFETVIELFAVTVNFLTANVEVLNAVELTGAEKITVPKLVPIPEVAVVIFT
jgi:hypothetical protein